MSKMTMEECQKIYGKHQEAHKESWRTWGDTQKLSREQVGMIAFFCPMEPMTHLLRELNQAGAIAETKEAKPTFLPIKRHVRWRDLEDGCVLRYCGNESGDYSHLESEGLLVLGELYTVKRDYDGITIPYSKTSRHGVHEGYWCGSIRSGECWEFVSNPNFVHGLDKRKTYFLKDQDKFGGTLKGPIKVLYEYDMGPVTENVRRSNRYVYTDQYCWLPVEDLTTEEPKPAEPTYKVYDGEVKASDKVWWWGDNGPKQMVASESLYNLRNYPDVYSIAEPPYTMTKLADGTRVKTYDYMQAPYRDYKKYQAAHPINKVCEVTSPADWQVGDVVTGNGNSITLGTRKEYVIESILLQGGRAAARVRVKGYAYGGPSAYHSSDNLAWVRRPSK